MTLVSDIMLQPGEWCVARAPSRVRTVLGSCVAILLWHSESKTLGISHFLLPTRATPSTSELEDDGRYGDQACVAMLSALRLQKIRAEYCLAHVYGGGDMFPELTAHQTGIGERNIQWALQWLQKTHARVVAKDVGESVCRSLCFDCNDGSITLRRYLMS